MNIIRFYSILCFFLILNCHSQIGIPVYSDYLSDNYYLLHPSMAGASNCDKIRLTSRKQWADQQDAPELQTISFNKRLDNSSAYGLILINDKNGYHSQKGLKLSYAHHLMFSRDEIDLNQLSFGLNANLFQSQLDESSWLKTGDSDPIVNGILIQDATLFNIDIGASYNFLNFYSHFTIDNIIENKQKIYTENETANLRRYLISSGYVFGNKKKILFEPSILFQYVEYRKEKNVDLNFKTYKMMENGKIWAALSYRFSFDQVNYIKNRKVNSQNLQYITPILGMNYKKYMFAYTYSYLPGKINFAGNFHQITLGYDVFCRKEKFVCECPAVN